MNAAIFMFSKEELKLLIKEVIDEALTEHLKKNRTKEELLNIQEAAALLNLAVSTMYEKTSERLIPHYKHGKKIMFKKSELVGWVESRRIKTIQEIRQEAVNKLSTKK